MSKKKDSASAPLPGFPLSLGSDTYYTVPQKLSALIVLVILWWGLSYFSKNEKGNGNGNGNDLEGKKEGLENENSQFLNPNIVMTGLFSGLFFMALVYFCLIGVDYIATFPDFVQVFLNNRPPLNINFKQKGQDFALGAGFGAAIGSMYQIGWAGQMAPYTGTILGIILGTIYGLVPNELRDAANPYILFVLPTSLFLYLMKIAFLPGGINPNTNVEGFTFHFFDNVVNLNSALPLSASFIPLLVYFIVGAISFHVLFLIAGLLYRSLPEQISV